MDARGPGGMLPALNDAAVAAANVGAPVAVDDVPVPDLPDVAAAVDRPGMGDLVVGLDAAGICGSDGVSFGFDGPRVGDVVAGAKSECTDCRRDESHALHVGVASR